MSFESEARYASVRELGEDLERFIAGRTVRAYRTGAWFELEKWVTRNKALATALGMVVVALAGGMVVVAAKNGTIQARNSALALKTGEAEASASLAESRRVEAEKEKTKAVKSAEETKVLAGVQSRILADLAADEFGHAFMVALRKDVELQLARHGRAANEVERVVKSLEETIANANPTSVAHQVLEQQVVRPALERIERACESQPLLAALLQTPLSATLGKIGLYDLGIQAARSSVETRRQLLGDTDIETLMSISNLADLLHGNGNAVEAESLACEAVTGFRSRLGNDDP
ncbi:MAG: tetratricopeptide repeat protein [Planctomycetes bacterium]|nr:tetratricopeptide repeat protein [Planctomycetota bacterium]